MNALHIDRSVLVVDKPPNLPFLADGWEPASPFLAKLLEAEYGRLWIVHRLDKITSGVLLLARTAEAHRDLSLQFERHAVHKVYHALANGSPDWKERTASQPLRANAGRKHRTVIDPRTGKKSKTMFSILERFARHCLLEAIPFTGRTHQIRAHAAGLGCSLLGDILYGAGATELIGRPALHSLSLTIKHPDTGQAVTYEAPYPADFSAAVRQLRRDRRLA